MFVTTKITLFSVDPSCSDDLLLYFPYDVDFDDVTCHHAKGYAYGDGVARIVNDVDRGKVVRFDGNVRIEVTALYQSVRLFVCQVVPELARACVRACVRTCVYTNK